MNNIFIEGIQGMGKSTLLNNIAANIPQYHVCHEGDYSPIDLAWCTWMTEEEYIQIMKKFETLHEEIIKNTIKEGTHYIVTYTKIITDVPYFHKNLENYEIYNGRKSLHDLKEIIFSRYRNFNQTGYLFECAFFQNIIEDLILFHLLDDNEIVEFYKELYNVIHKEEFVLLYLYSDKLEENIKHIKKERCANNGNELWYSLMLEYFINSPYGKQHGFRDFDDMITHFKHRQQLELHIINEVIGNDAILIPAKDWRIEDIIKKLQ